MLLASSLTQPKVMVWPGEAQAPVSEAEAALRSEGVAVVPWIDARDAVAEHRTTRSAQQERRRAQVETALAEARDRFLHQELTTMLEILDEAEPHAVALAEPGHCEGLWELEFRRGLGHGARGEPGDAAATLARYEFALALYPDRRPLDELYGPDVAAAFLAAVDHRSQRMARPVAMRVQPSDATVEIDCRVSEEVEPSLRPGLHALRVFAPGFEPWAGVVDLREGGAIEVSLSALPPELSPAQTWARSSATYDVDDGSDSAYHVVSALARDLGAEAVLVISQSEAGVRIRVWGRDGPGAVVLRPSLAEAVHAAMNLLGPDGRLAVLAPILAGGTKIDDPPGEPVSSQKPVLRTWWFWTLVGSVAVTGAAVGLGLGLGRRDPRPGRLTVIAR